MRGLEHALEHAYTESYEEKIRKWMKKQISVGKSFLQAQGFYSELFNNHVSFIGMRWDCCSRNCLVGLAMKVSVVVHLVRTVARKNIVIHC